MKPVSLQMKCAFALVIGAVFAAGPVLAEKPTWAGSGKGGKDQRAEQRDDQKGGRRDQDRASAAERRHFEDQHRVAVRQYYGEHYGEQFRGRRCPPGLAKKHNGCMPPGLAKKWQVGRPLPSNVVYYDVPQPLVMQIGLPPPGYRYVRVAGDILMISIGTRLIVDAIQDLGR